jgi:DNA-binding transcriptional ArsR family regulator
MGGLHAVASTTEVGAHDAEQVARVMSALATASRVRILAQLRQGPCSVGELTAGVEMAQPAVSHQLRILRDLGLVVGSRQGRHTFYALHDGHVRSLLDEALRHIEHVRTGDTDAGPAGPASNTSTRRIHMTDQHSHETPHAHQHEHADASHEHAHSTHDHAHVEHEHEHEHDAEAHTHGHVHEDGQEADHAHSHA